MSEVEKGSKKPSKMAWVNCLRGIAILMVILVHVGQRVPLDSQNWVVFFENGRFGVQLFFIASAFTLINSWHRRQNEPSRTRNFFIRRFFRIAPIYWLGIVVYSIVAFATQKAELNGAFIGTHFLLAHGLYPAAFLKVVPGGWSIGVEMLFYAAVPFVASRIAAIRPALVLTTALLLISLGIRYGLMPTVSQEARAYWDLSIWSQAWVFGLGISLYLLWAEQKIPRLIPVPVAAIVVFCAMFTPGDLANFVLPLSLCLLAASAATSRFSSSILETVGIDSFSIYICHFILVSAVHSIFRKLHFAPSAPIFFAVFYLLVVAAALAIASVLRKLIEEPGIAMGEKVIANLSQRPASET